MASFLMVHGSWHCGCHWERLAAILRAKGHAVRAPDLPGMGLDQTLFSRASFEGCAEFVLAQAQEANRRVILVGIAVAAR